MAKKIKNITKKNFFWKWIHTNKKIFLSFFLISFFAGIGLVYAAVTITSGTGATNITADKAGNAITSGWTTLGDITIKSAASNDFSKNQSNRTLILTAPTNWRFMPNTGTAAATGTAITVNSLVVTTSRITVTFTRTNTNSSNAGLIISNIKVQAITGNIIPSTGNILRTTANPGTATINGITNGTTNFGSLSQAAGSGINLILTIPGQTFIGGIGNSGSTRNFTAGVSFTIVKITAVDQFKNIVTSYTGSKILAYTGPAGTNGYTTGVAFTMGQSTTTLTTTLNIPATGVMIIVTDGMLTGLASSSFSLIDGTPPVLTEVTAVQTPTNDTTPSYTFNSNEIGTISYSGACSSITTSAVSGNNIITFNTLAQGTYSTCKIRVTDTANNPSSRLTVNTFTTDTTAPVDTLKGSGTVYIEYGDNYSESGSTWTDAVDGSGTIAVPTSGSVNTGMIGTYILTYKKIDAAGNTGNIVTRTVIIRDTTAPVIILNGTSTNNIEYGDNYTELGATRSDIHDGSGNAIISGSVNTGVLGTYIVSYSKIDDSGNTGNSITRTVNIIDTTAPAINTITLNPNLVGTIAQITITESITDLHGVSNVNASMVGPLSFITDITLTLISGNAQNGVWRGVYTFLSGASDGRYDIFGFAIDNRNNTGYQTIGQVILDRTAPTISATSITPLYVGIDSNAIVTVSARDTTLGINSITAKDRSTNISASLISGTSLPTTAGQVGTWIFAQSVTGVQGIHIEEIVATDIVNNSSKTNGSFFYDSIKPTATIVYSITGPTHQDVIATLTGYSEAIMIIDNDGLYTYSFNNNDSFTFEFEDIAGNTGEVTSEVTRIDKTSPEIMINGASIIYVEYGDNYTEPGATRGDNVDGFGDVDIISGSVDTGNLGTYILQYIYTDTAGNIGTGSRTVIIRDTNSPIVTLNGSSDINVEYKNNYTESGATRSDIHDGSGDAIISGSVNTGILGIYIVSYSKIDDSGNTGNSITRTVHVVDTTKPIITLLGNNEVTVEVYSSFIDEGATASDNYDGDITADIVTIDSVNTSIIGNYIVTYDTVDTHNNRAAQATRIVNVVDTTAPIITLNGASTSNIEYGDNYTELGATRTDAVDGSGDAIINGSVDTGVVGTYILTYSKNDVTGNTGNIVTRTVHIIDTTNPVISTLTLNPTLVGTTAQITIIENITDLNGVNSVNVSISGSSEFISGISLTLISGNTQNGVWRGAYTFLSGASDGTYSLSSVSSDNANNSEYQNIGQIILDRTAPTISATSITPLYIGMSSSATVTVSARDTTLGINSITAKDRSTNISASLISGTSLPTTAGQVGTWIFAQSVTGVQGIHIEEIVATDIVNNSSKTNGSFFYDSIKPTATIVYSITGPTHQDVIATLTGYSEAIMIIDNDGLYTYSFNNNDSFTFEFEDIAGNTGEVTSEVTRIDKTSPEIMINGASIIYVEYGDNYTEPGATRGDNVDGFGDVDIISGSVDTGNLGTYILQYIYTDTAGNIGTGSRTVNVIDTTKPVITLLGNDEVNLEVHSLYTDAGATASDNFDGNITTDIVTTNTVNTEAIGIYTVKYNVTDTNGNIGIEVTRTVNIQAPSNTAPIATGVNFTTNESTILTIDIASGVLNSNQVYDAENNTLHVIINTLPTHGIVTMNTSDGSFSYLPDQYFNGTDYFTYYINDGTVNSNLVTGTIIVTPIAITEHINIPSDTENKTGIIDAFLNNGYQHGMGSLLGDTPDICVGNKSISTESSSGKIVIPFILQSSEAEENKIEMQVPANIIVENMDGTPFRGVITPPTTKPNDSVGAAGIDNVISVVEFGNNQNAPVYFEYIHTGEDLSDEPNYDEEAEEMHANIQLRIPAPGANIGDIVSVYYSHDGTTWIKFVPTNVIEIDGKPYVSIISTHLTMFAIANETGSFVINNDAASINSDSVTLNISASGTQNMRFSNTGVGGPRSNWETYSTTKQWTLSTGYGTKTVRAQFDTDGITATVEAFTNDSIEYISGAEAIGIAGTGCTDVGSGNNVTLCIEPLGNGYCEYGNNLDLGITGYSTSSRDIISSFNTASGNTAWFCNDLQGAAPRTLNIQSSNLLNITTNNPEQIIPATNIYIKNPPAVVPSGQGSCTVNVGSSSNQRTSIANSTVILGKSNSTGEVCKVQTSQFDLKVSIPIYQALGQYSGTLTITVPNL